jgi:hypothetical protein
MTQTLGPTKRLQRGVALPSPAHVIETAKKHVPDVKVKVPSSFLMWPIQMSFWGNQIDGDCVTAEEAFAKAIMSPQTFIPEATAVAWSTENGYANGAYLPDVMKSMHDNGFPLNNKTYGDGSYSYVDFTNAATLKSAIYSVGTVKIGVGAEQFQKNPNGVVTGGTSGWTMYNYPKNLQQDHCTSVCGFGTLADLVKLFKQHGITVNVASGMPTGNCYAMFSWNSIGIVDEQSLLNMTHEAWVRHPATIVVDGVRGHNGKWHLQQINLGALTKGPAAVSDPTAYVYNDQSHVLYRDGSGKIWDSWFDSHHWNLQQINLGALTKGPAAVSDPTAYVYNDQSHVLYRDGSGKIWDSWFDSHHWNLQQINNDGLTAGPAAVSDPTAYVYNGQSHVLYRDGSEFVWDSWYDGSNWYLQQINLGGVANGPAAVGDPASFVYNDQSHVLYRDGSGKIWDSWFSK